MQCGPRALCKDCASRVMQAKKKCKKDGGKKPQNERPVLIGTAALRVVENEGFCAYYK